MSSIIHKISRIITEDPDIQEDDYRDYKKLLDSFDKESERLGLQISTLGEVDDYQIRLARPPNLNKNLNNILLIAGFHGEEPAAVLGILEFLKSAPDDILNFINISIIPSINPYGFENNERYGIDSTPTNQVMVKEKLEPSKNCKILLDSEDLIKELSSACLLDLHENSDVNDEFYIYVNAPDLDDSGSKDLVDVARLTALRHFKQRKDGHYKDSHPGKAEYDVESGIVRNVHDGSFDDYIGKHNTVIILETPAKKEDKLKERVEAHKDFIESIVAQLYNDVEDVDLMALPDVNQTTRNSCGGACLKSIVDYFNNTKVPEGKINRMSDISDEGIDVHRIVETASEFGLNAKTFEKWNIGGLKSFLDKDIPVIVAIVAWGDDQKDYTNDKDGHYVVAIGYDKSRIYLMDPSMKYEDHRGYLNWREFYTRWHDIDGPMVGIPIWGDRKNIEKKPKGSFDFMRIP